MSERGLRRLGWWVFALIAAIYAVALVYGLFEPAALGDTPFDAVVFPLLTIASPLVGVLIANRQPRNPIGWILLGVGLAWATSFFLNDYVDYSLRAHPGSLPGGAVALVLSQSAWIPGIVPMGTFLLMLFPDGRLPSPRWRPLAWASGLAMVVVALVIVLMPGRFADAGYPHVSNPLGLGALKPVAGPARLTIVLLPICMLGSALAVIVRFRRSRGVERLQMKWLAASAAVVLFLPAVAEASAIGTSWGGRDTPLWAVVVQDLAIASVVLIPVSIGFAILRHRLYDIDRIISRALGYAVITAVLVGLYALVVVGIGSALGRSDNPVLIAGATLAVAALFGPARRRIQSMIDRRFYRRRYDAERTLAAFSSGLRDEVDLGELRSRLLAVVGETIQPTTVTLWLAEATNGTENGADSATYTGGAARRSVEGESSRPPGGSSR